LNYNREQQKKSWKRIKDGTVGTAEPDLILGAIPKIDGNARNKILGISFGQHLQAFWTVMKRGIR
jgi:hypothetical protein